MWNAVWLRPARFVRCSGFATKAKTVLRVQNDYVPSLQRFSGNIVFTIKGFLCVHGRCLDSSQCILQGGGCVEHGTTAVKCWEQALATGSIVTKTSCANSVLVVYWIRKFHWFSQRYSHIEIIWCKRTWITETRVINEILLHPYWLQINIIAVGKWMLFHQ